MPIRKWIAAYLIILVVTLLVSGCLGSKAPVTVSPSPPVKVLDYHRTGGIAGVDDRLVVFDSGATLLSTRSVNRELHINSSEFERLERIFIQAEFDTLEDNYTSVSGGADFMRYRITFRNKTVISEDTVIPFSLQPVIRELNALISTSSSQNQISGSLANIHI
jgi:hypothetical protein